MDERYYDASLAKQRNMMNRVKAALKKAGIEAHIVRGAFRPVLEINEPRKRKGEVTQYSISFD